MWNVFSLHCFAVNHRREAENSRKCLLLRRSLPTLPDVSLVSPPARLLVYHTYPFRLLIGEDAALSACCEVAVNLEGVP